MDEVKNDTVVEFESEPESEPEAPIVPDQDYGVSEGVQSYDEGPVGAESEQSGSESKHDEQAVEYTHDEGVVTGGYGDPEIGLISDGDEVGAVIPKAESGAVMPKAEPEVVMPEAEPEVGTDIMPEPTYIAPLTEEDLRGTEEDHSVIGKIKSTAEDFRDFLKGVGDNISDKLDFIRDDESDETDSEVEVVEEVEIEDVEINGDASEAGERNHDSVSSLILAVGRSAINNIIERNEDHAAHDSVEDTVTGKESNDKEAEDDDKGDEGIDY